MLMLKNFVMLKSRLNFVHVDDVIEGHFLEHLNMEKLVKDNIIKGQNITFKDFLDKVVEYGNVPKVKVKLNPKYLYFFAIINEFFAKIFFTC